MTVTNTTANSGSTPVYGAAANARVAKKTLGQEDFLKLMTVQLSKQDPMKPVDDTAFVAQMAQFTSLEQSSAMAKDMAALRSDFSLQSASGMIGRDVTFKTDSGDVTGKVDAVDASGDSVKVSVGGNLYNLSQVVRVAPAAVATQPST